MSFNDIDLTNFISFQNNFFNNIDLKKYSFNFLKNYVKNNQKHINFSKLIDDNILEKIKSLINDSVNDKFFNIYQSGRYAINTVFQKQVNQNTLVISTIWQHNSVNKILTKYKNLQIIDILNFSIEQFQNIIKNTKFKKIFIYIASTIKCRGLYIQQKIFQNIILILKKYNKEYKIMIDAVHELFMFNRDYSIFDYIIYTAHATIANHNFGLLISSEKIKDIDISQKLLLTYHYNSLKKLKEYFNNIKNFKLYLIQFFKQLTNDYRFNIMPISYKNTVNHIFGITAKNIFLTQNQLKKLAKTKLQIQKKNNEYYLYLRNHLLINKSSEELIQNLNYIKLVLSNIPELPDNICSNAIFFKYSNTHNKQDFANQNIIKNKFKNIK